MDIVLISFTNLTNPYLSGNCSADSWDNHWCTSYIGIEKPFLIGFASKLKNPCGSPSVEIEIHRSEYLEQTWVLTSKHEAHDQETFSANLTTSIVGGKSLRMRKTITKASKYTAVDLEAHIEKSDGGKTLFEVGLSV